MPLAAYINEFANLNPTEAIERINDGYYTIDQLDSLYRNETRAFVAQAIEQNFPVGRKLPASPRRANTHKVAKSPSRNLVDLQRQHMHEVCEDDLQRMDGEKSTMVEISTVVEKSVDTAVEWVEASRRYAQVSVICAARAGAEFARIKEQCRHGEWMQVLKLLPVGKETVYKYIKVAEELQHRMAEGGDAFDLLGLPAPEQLADPIFADELERVNQVTGEQTLRQLYFDWGICKAPAALGGARKVTERTPKELAEVRRQDANETVGALCTDIQNCCINEKRCIQLADPAFLKLLEGDLVDALHNVRTLIKAG